MRRKNKASPKNKSGKLWKNYEDAVREIIKRQKDIFGLKDVDSTASKVPGQSGYEWNIEITAYTSTAYPKGEKDVLVEARRISRNLKPAEAAELAFRVEDTGASKGYFVTPLGRRLSKGAEKIARYKQIGHIEVSDTATAHDYIMRYLNSIFVQVSDDMFDVISNMKDSVRIMIADTNGNTREATVNEVNAMSQSAPTKKSE